MILTDPCGPEQDRASARCERSAPPAYRSASRLLLILELRAHTARGDLRGPHIGDCSNRAARTAGGATTRLLRATTSCDYFVRLLSGNVSVLAAPIRAVHTGDAHFVVFVPGGLAILLCQAMLGVGSPCGN